MRGRGGLPSKVYETGDDFQDLTGDFDHYADHFPSLTHHFHDHADDIPSVVHHYPDYLPRSANDVDHHRRSVNGQADNFAENLAAFTEHRASDIGNRPGSSNDRANDVPGRSDDS